MSAPTFEPERFLAQLPRRPGVYVMQDANQQVLYVGKARNLKARVTSYFRASGLSAKTLALVARIGGIRITVTNSETEALLLEQSLIKSERPPYNIVLRDDKSYPYIHLTGDPEFARLTFHRGARSKRGRYFGPYPSAYAVRDSLNVLQKLFRIRQCDNAYFRNRSRPCLQFQINRCTAPCVGLITAADYQQDVARAVKFLEGRSGDVLDEYKAAMDTAAEALEFEKAARYRDQIAHLRRVQEAQYVDAASGNADIIAAVRAPGGICIEVQFLRQGRMLGHRTWFPDDQLEQPVCDVLQAFIGQFYLGGGQGGFDLPQEVIVNESLADAPLLAAALGTRAGRQVRVTHRVRGQRLRWLEMATESARAALGAHQVDREHVRDRLQALADELALTSVPQRLECFDISHSSGEATVASCVVFDGSGPLKSDYRRFNIDGVTPGDDYAAMEQALRRRYTRVQAGEVKTPDILLVDGGKGQLAQARAVLAAVGLDGILTIAVAKGSTRRPGLETLLVGDGSSELMLDAANPALHLIQHIRDEAHRFAITGHRLRRGRKRVTSELQGIPGIGAARRRELLRHFGAMSAVRGASLDELARVPGIDRKLAAVIHAALHND